ncbi:MAG: hypothetical protein JO272_02840 [Pseudonocardiales bacterium]|nr:hypothetical protein [Pseudonocardiales bacterium]
MRLKRLAKDGDSNPTGCQTVYLTEDGRFGIQGDVADDDTYANLENLLLGEGAVLIKPEIVIEAVRRYQERMA